MALCPSCVPTPQPGRPLQPFLTACGEAGSWGGSPGDSSLPASSTGRDALGIWGHGDTRDKRAAPGAEMAARDDALAKGRDGDYCSIGPTSGGGGRSLLMGI